MCLLPAFVIASGIEPAAAAQNLRESARRQAIENPGRPIVIPAPPAEYWPKTIDEVAREADVVLVATLSRLRSYLGRNEDRVLTDYSGVGANVIAGRLPVASAPDPAAVPPLILTVYGGEVMIEGIPVRGSDRYREAIEDGAQYVLFLKKAPVEQPGRYEIYHGGIFRISKQEVRPLLENADDVFKGTVDTNLDEFISRIQEAGSPR